MSLINQDVLFDRLKEYIDLKIDNAYTMIKDMLDEYGVKAVAGMEAELKAVTSEPLYSAIIESHAGIAAALTAESFAAEPFGSKVKEYYFDSAGNLTYNTTNEYSSKHWAVVSGATEGASLSVALDQIKENTIDIERIEDAMTTEVAMDIKEYVANNNQTDFAIRYGYNKVIVQMNGITLINVKPDCTIDDYELTGSGIKLALSAFNDDNIKIIGFDYQGDVRGTLFPMNTLYPSDNLHPMDDTLSCIYAECLTPDDSLFPSETLHPKACS